MELRKARIQNFKCFEDEVFEFPERFTMVIGNNGSGKTALLDALSIIVESYLVGLNETKSSRLKKGEVRRSYTNDRQYQEHFPVVFEAIDMSILEQKANGARRKAQKNVALSNKGNKAVTVGRAHVELLQTTDSQLTLPLISYHGVDRLWKKETKSSSKEGKLPYMQRGERLDGYFSALNAQSSNSLFQSWFKTFEDQVLKFGEDKTLYYALTNAITAAVPQWSEIHFSWHDDDMLGLFEDENGQSSWRPFSLLSDGYRSFISLVADLAWRCIQLNPHLGADAVKETPGLVLIDELDMHLHPKWQRTVIQSLKDSFPKVQFIATTHSPLLVQSLTESEVILLNGPKSTPDEDKGKDDFKRWRVEQILTSSLFGISGIRSEEVTRLEKRKGELLAIPEKKRKDEERYELARIEEQMGDLPTALDPEEREYRATIKKAAKDILKEMGL